LSSHESISLLRGKQYTETPYSVIVSYYEDAEYVELAENADRAAMRALAALIASHAMPEICWV
jgi:hypothetical protein